MDILEGLNTAMAYLEAQLCGKPDLAQAARLASHSADGFARMFSYLTGMSAGEYIRRRRLSEAARELQNGHAVLETALDWGYKNPDAFRRAFVKQHGITPSEARKPGAVLKIFPPLTFKIDFLGGREMDFRIVETEEIRLRGVSKAFEGGAAERFSQEHIMWADHHDNAMGRISMDYKGEWFGIWNNGIFWIARRPALADGPGDLADVSIPKGSYAVFRTGCGGYAGDELPKLRGEIFGAWLAGSGYRQTRDYEIEVYHLAPSEKEKRWYELWIPIEEN